MIGQNLIMWKILTNEVTVLLVMSTYQISLPSPNMSHSITSLVTAEFKILNNKHQQPSNPIISKVFHCILQIVSNHREIFPDAPQSLTLHGT